MQIPDQIKNMFPAQTAQGSAQPPQIAALRRGPFSGFMFNDDVAQAIPFIQQRQNEILALEAAQNAALASGRQYGMGRIMPALRAYYDAGGTQNRDAYFNFAPRQQRFSGLLEAIMSGQFEGSFPGQYGMLRR